MRPTVVLFTRDLRLDDNPALAAAVAAAHEVVPLFVLDDRLLRRRPRRSTFLKRCLVELDADLRAIGGRLVVRVGDPVAETARVVEEAGADAVHVAADVTPYASRRLERLRTALPRVAVRVWPGVAVVEAGALAPPGRDHYRVFTPYHRAWTNAPWRVPVPAPRSITVPAAISSSPWTVEGMSSIAAGEGAARRHLDRFLHDRLASYAEQRDDLAAGGTSGLSPYLRLGCISALRVALAAGDGPFTRQLAWRDFYGQVLAANPDSLRDDMLPSRSTWEGDLRHLEAWRRGETGVPIVDAGMRQLATEGTMHNRTRMIVASFLTKDLDIHWRFGAQHFDAELIDGDPANNIGGWQWAAGTGVDTRPGRMFNPWLQGERFDGDGTYIRRHVPELADVAARDLHDPRRLAGTLPPGHYPTPIVDHADAARRYRALSR